MPYRNARDFVIAMEAQYAQMTTYRDTGFVRSLGMKEADRCWFETQFHRPDKFRFQFATPHPYRPLRRIVTEYAIGTDGSVPYFWTRRSGSEAEAENKSTLEMAVAGATGISHGTAHTIAALLMESIGGLRFSALKRLRFRDSRAFEDVMCVRVTGRHRRGGRYTLWIGAHDMLLRKVVCHWANEEEVRRRITVDEDIDPTIFASPK